AAEGNARGVRRADATRSGPLPRHRQGSEAEAAVAGTTRAATIRRVLVGTPPRRHSPSYASAECTYAFLGMVLLKVRALRQLAEALQPRWCVSRTRQVGCSSAASFGRKGKSGKSLHSSSCPLD